MLLVEADGKTLLRESGIAIPESAVSAGVRPTLPGAGPWVVKAQVPVGGRGKAGGVVLCKTPNEVDVEQASSPAAHSRLCEPDQRAIVAAIRELAAHESSDRSAALIDTGEKL